MTATKFLLFTTFQAIGIGFFFLKVHAKIFLRSKSLKQGLKKAAKTNPNFQAQHKAKKPNKLL